MSLDIDYPNIAEGGYYYITILSACYSLGFSYDPHTWNAVYLATQVHMKRMIFLLMIPGLPRHDPFSAREIFR